MQGLHSSEWNFAIPKRRKQTNCKKNEHVNKSNIWFKVHVDPNNFHVILLLNLSKRFLTNVILQEIKTLKAVLYYVVKKVLLNSQ